MLLAPQFERLEILWKGVKTSLLRGELTQNAAPALLKTAPRHDQNAVHDSLLRFEFETLKTLSTRGGLTPLSLSSIDECWELLIEDKGARPLLEYLNNKKPTFDVFFQIAEGIITALSYAHNEHIPHKNLNPRNILIHPENYKVYFIGFGHISIPVMSALEKYDLAYISPEQTQRLNRSVDYRTDFYSLGIIFYELLTGEHPFESKTPMEAVHKHIALNPTPAYVLNPNIPKQLWRIIEKMMHKNTIERYQNCSGILADMNTCYEMWRNNDKSNFPLGRKDSPKLLLRPGVLYGRSAEIEILQKEFRKVMEGSCGVVFIRGEAGLGKSSLAKTLEKILLENRGFFISGKYKKGEKKHPYSGVIKASRDLLRQIIIEGRESIDTWKKTLNEEMGARVDALAKVAPELEILIESQESKKEYETEQYSAYLAMALIEFYKVFSSPAHPCVLLLEDLQWADQASFDLLTAMLLSSEMSGFLFIGAYQNPNSSRQKGENDTSKKSGLDNFVTEMQAGLESYDPVKNIQLRPMTQTHIVSMLADALHEERAELQELAEVVYAKTGGNPLYITQFLEILCNRRLLTYENGWNWNIDQIKIIELKGDILTLMAERIRGLPKKTIELVKIAACLGMDFPLGVLTRVYDTNQQKLYKQFKIAQEEAILIQRGSTVSFVHGQMRKAAYTFLTDEQVKQYNYMIGRALVGKKEIEVKWETVSEQARVGRVKQQLAEKNNFERLGEGGDLFHVVGYWSQAKDVLTENEQTMLLDWSIQAGMKAKNTAGFETAYTYFQQADGLLQEDTWNRQYAKTLLLYLEWAEAAYMATYYTEAERIIEVIDKNAKTMIDRMRAHKVSMLIYQKTMQPQKAVSLAHDVFKQVGISLPAMETVNKEAVNKQLQRFREKRQNQNIITIMDLPEAQDPQISEALMIMAGLFVPLMVMSTDAYHYVVIEHALLSLEYGLCPTSGYAFSKLGAMLCTRFQQYDEGYEVGQVALLIQQRLGDPRQWAETMLSFYNMIHFFKQPLRWGREKIMEAHQAGMSTGNLQFAAYAINHYCLRGFLCGEHLETVHAEYEKFAPVIEKLGQEDALIGYNTPRQCVEMLLGKNHDSGTFSGSYFDENEAIPLLLENGHKKGIGGLYIFKLLQHFLNDEQIGIQKVIQTDNVEKDIRTNQGHFQGIVGLFLLGLAKLRSTAPEKSGAKEDGFKIVEEFKVMAVSMSENFGAMALLLEAESLRISGDEREALDVYDKSIAEAGMNGFTYVEIIANLATANFWEQLGKQKFADMYRKDALLSAEKWGAARVVKTLKDTYPRLGGRSFQTEQISAQIMDFDSIMKAASSISGEIVLDKLIAALMGIVIENAGASSGALILDRDGRLLVEAQAKAGQQVRIQQGAPLEFSENIIPGIVKFVERTGESVILDNTCETGNEEFREGRRNTKAVMCTPLHAKSKFIGALYLENTLMKGVFSPQRVEVVKLLASHIAISLENARLYAEIAHSEQRFRQLADAAWEAVVIHNNGVVLQANDQFYQMFGYSQAEIINNQALPKIVSSESLPMVMDRIAADDKGPYELKARRKDGSEFDVEVRIRDMMHGGKNVRVATIRDITAHKHAEEQLNQLNRHLEELVKDRTSDLNIKAKELKKANKRLRKLDELKSDLLSTVSHDIRTPLTSILGFAKLLDRIFRRYFEPLANDEQLNIKTMRVKNYLRIMDVEGRRLTRLVDDFLDLSKIESGVLQWRNQRVDPGELVEQAIQMVRSLFADKPQVKLVSVVPESLPQIYVDPDRIVQVLHNLLGNAFKFTEQGEVSIAVQEEPKDWLEIRVSDTGQGIKEDQLDIIFDKFHQATVSDTLKTTQKGTGLGLAICKQIAEHYGGSVSASSEPGKGATFQVKLPVDIPAKIIKGDGE